MNQNKNQYLSNELKLTINLVHFAAKISNNLQSSNMGVSKKNDGSPVTVADFAIQYFLEYWILQYYPTDQIISEENLSNLDTTLISKISNVMKKYLPANLIPHDGYLESKQRSEKPSYQNHGRYWVIDPIDGTKGFMNGDHYAISICLFEESTQLMSVISVPKYITGESIIYAAQQGIGTYSVDLKTTDSNLKNKIQLNQKFDLRGNKIPHQISIIRSKHHSYNWVDQFLKSIDYQIADISTLDGTGKFCSIADGTNQLYIRPLSDKSKEIWDCAAGELIIKEAGGIVTDFNGEEFVYSGEFCHLTSKGYISCHPSIHKSIIESLSHFKKEITS